MSAPNTPERDAEIAALIEEHGMDQFRKAAVKMITLTPSWAGMVPVLIVLLECGTHKGKQDARAELARMARLADLYVATLKKDA